jgi:hypothetical protein
MNPIKSSAATLIFFFTISHALVAQNLDDLVKNAEKEKDKTALVTGTFKGTRLILGHSVEAPAKGVLQVMFSHRFGTLEDPLYTFLGMNQASIRFGFDYGISDRLAAGIGRSSGLGATTPPPTYDFYLKYKVLRQSAGAKAVPVSLSVLAATSINTERWPDDGVPRSSADRMSYTGQVLIARKFNERFSLQLMPTLVHRNLTDSPDQLNTLFAIGFGGRMKLGKRTALTAEYYFNKPNSLGAGYYDPFSIGFDIDTGGHIFQIMLTNSMGLIEPQFLGNTSTNFFDGPKAVRLGFNFSRVFTVRK